jgi:radical SAM superfamily enzyme YgiQ (UPF0313 family)
MARIVLVALNARYIHPSLGARSLLANLGPLASEAVLVEALASDRPLDVVERVLALGPRVVGLGVYVWCADAAARVVALLKRVAPDVVVVVGGPELLGDPEGHPAAQEADVRVVGEGEHAFHEVCARVLAGQGPGPRVVQAPPPDPATLALPDAAYTDHDLAHRFVYVETTRGCPGRCAFCVSACGPGLRRFPLAAVQGSLGRLFDRGALGFKLVDRSFNADARRAEAVLRFLLGRWREGMHLHLEWLPERAPERLLGLLAAFPRGAVQVEVGVQTWDPEVSAAVDRPCRPEAIERGLRALVEQSGAHVHADLIAGLPGEGLASFAAGFDRLWRLGVHEIQVGVLKRLPGTPLARPDPAWGLVHDPAPPYEVLVTGVLPFETLQRVKRFARAWDLVGNSGNFRRTLPRLLSGPSAHGAFDAFAQALFGRLGRTSGVALDVLAGEVHRWLVDERGGDPVAVAADLAADWAAGGRRGVPEPLRPWVDDVGRPRAAEPGVALQRRQARHRS